jgi:hypothetical protein
VIRQGDRETRRQGEGETGGQGESILASPRSLSRITHHASRITLPLLLVSLSPCLLVCRSSAQKPPNPFDVEAREYYGTPESELAVRKGLEYLAQKQAANGHWDSGIYRDDAAVSGLCTLAFLSAGHQPGRGKYGDILNRAADYLADSVQRNGLVGRGGSAGPPMYGHGFATLCLAELYGMTKREDFRTKVEAAVNLIVTAQNSEGGWRYQPGSTDADISVTAVQVLALRAAANAGIKVPAEPVKKAIAYIKRCANNMDGGFSYQVSQHGSGPARTGAAVTCLMISGEKSAPETQEGIRYLMEHPLETDEWQYRQHEFYAYYYCTQAFYQVGGDKWKQWFTGYTSPKSGKAQKGIRDRLVDRQASDGAWEERSGVGREYATAMAILVLQVPAGLLPIYQK